jgi:hypothetical protein
MSPPTTGGKAVVGGLMSLPPIVGELMSLPPVVGGLMSLPPVVGELMSLPPVSIREYRRGNQKWTIQRNCHHTVHKTQDEDKQTKPKTKQHRQLLG